MKEITIESKNLEKYIDLDEYVNTLNLQEVIKKHPDVRRIKLNCLNSARDIKNFILKISSINLPKLELNCCNFDSIFFEENSSFEMVEIRNGDIGAIGITNSSLEKVTIRNGDIGEIGITNCKSNSIEIYNCNLELKSGPRHYKLKIGKVNISQLIIDSYFQEIVIDNDSKIDSDSKIEGLTLSGHDEKWTYLSVGSAILKRLDIYGLNCTRLNFRKSKIGRLSLSNIEFDTEVYPYESDEFFVTKDALIKKICVTDSKFPFHLKVGVGIKNLKEIELLNNSIFKSLTINHKNANIKIDDCTIEEKLTIGSKLTEANSSNFEITNNTFVKGVLFGKHHIKDEFKIEGNRLQNGKWKFYGFSLGGNFNSEITDQSFDDVTFQNCDFSNFDFQHTDIHLAEIINPTWKEVDIGSKKRLQFKAEKEALELSDLNELKKQYSFFRKKFESENNYVDASKFKISEALTRIKIEKCGRKLLLYFNKWLNMFGESIARPLKWYFATLVVFAIIYLLTGFHIGEDQIKYKVVLKGFKDAPNLDFPSICEIGESLLFSFKNISPVKLEYDFDFRASRPTQIISMLQKLINIILVGALYASMRNFFRK